MLIAYRTYPHIDQYERAWQGAELLERAMQGEIRPATVIARRPMIFGLDHGRTQRGPMAELIARGEALENCGEALVVSICAGFSHANIREVGPSVTVTVDGSTPQGQAIAEEFMDYAWETRDFTTVKLLPVAEAVALARQGRPGDKPLVVADYTDNPGGGGYGDATAFLKGLVENGVESVAFHAICDPEAVQQGMSAGVGAKTTLSLGGKTDPSLGGGPLTSAAHRAVGDEPAIECNYGPSMVFRVGGIDIIVITNNGQAVDLAQFTSLGTDPTRYRTVAVKSMQHFRAAFEPIAREIVLVDTGALCSEIYTPELFTRVCRPIWPLDPIPDLRATWRGRGRRAAFIPPAFRPCASQRNKWLQTRHGSFALPNIRSIRTLPTELRRPSDERCSKSDRRGLASAPRRGRRRHVRSHL
jgi:microcystin degradation protein MlrC